MRASSQPGSRTGEENPKPGQRREHHVERVGRIAAVGARIGQRADELGELDNRARVAVGDRSAAARPAPGERTCRKWIGWPSIVGHELRERVEPRLLRAPVVLVAPVGDELLEVVARDAPLPADARAARAASASGEPLAQVLEVGVGDRDVERVDVVVMAATLRRDAERFVPHAVWDPS